MARIITFTANLLAETIYEYGSWTEGKTQRAVGESFQVGGKGINVSKMLDRLGAENSMICFPGGAFGPMCLEWMERAGLSVMPFVEGCVARSGSVLRSGANGETTFLGLDSVVSVESIRNMVTFLRKIEGEFVFAVCGSIQGWADSRWEPLREWIVNRGVNVTLVIDNYGASLPWLSEQGPEIIKFNRDELELLFEEGERGLATEELLVLADERLACSCWAVTDGENPIWIKESGSGPVRIMPPVVECVSPTGCGDVFFATLLDCLYNRDGYDLKEAAERAAEFASRSAALPGIAEFEV